MKSMRTALVTAGLLLSALLGAAPASALSLGYYQDPYNVNRPLAGVVLMNSDGTLYTAGGGGGGGSVTIANGADVVEGTNTDAAGAASVFGMVKGIYGYEAARAATAQAVSGTVAATQSGTWNIGTVGNITGTVSLPTGAATSANQTATGASAQTVQGSVANGGAEVGNPVATGGVAATPWSLPTAQTAGTRVKAAYTTNGAMLDVPVPQASSYHLASAAASGGAVNVKASAGSVCQITGYNTLAAVTWIHVYNKATAPTFGTDASDIDFPSAASAAFSYTVQNCKAETLGIGLTFSSDAVATQGLAAGAVIGVDVIYN